MKEIRIFISQPTENKDIKDIENERSRIIEKIERKYKNTPNKTYIYPTILDSDKFPKDKLLWNLSKIIDLLSTADLVIFSANWEKDNTCRLVHELCIEYNIPIRSVI